MEPLPIEAMADAGPSVLDAVSTVTNPIALASIVDTSKFLTHWNLLLVVAVWSLLQAVKRVLPDEWFDEGTRLYRVWPLAPIVACNIAVWIPGPWLDPAEVASQRLILGTILGMICGKAHTIFSRLGLHSMLHVESDTRKLPKRRAKVTRVEPLPPEETTEG